MQKILILLFCILLFQQKIIAQSPQFSQQYANPLLLNPALCGENKGTRYMLNARNQWSTVAGGYRTYAIGWDHYLPEMRAGIGMSIWRDVAGVNKLATTHISGYFAHKIKISKTQGFKAGLRFSHVIRNVDTSRMLFADQVIRDNSTSSLEPNILEKVSYQEIGLGLLYHSKNWWAGFSMDNLNRPNSSLSNGGEVPNPIKHSLHGGIILKEKKGYRNYTAKLAYEYKFAQDWDQLDIGVHYRFDQFVIGGWYRGLPVKSYSQGYSNHDAIILLLGMELEGGWKIGYSYDLTISKLTTQSGGSHEISMMYEIPGKGRRKKIIVPPCMVW